MAGRVLGGKGKKVCILGPWKSRAETERDWDGEVFAELGLEEGFFCPAGCCSDLEQDRCHLVEATEPA